MRGREPSSFPSCGIDCEIGPRRRKGVLAPSDFPARRIGCQFFTASRALSPTRAARGESGVAVGGSRVRSPTRARANSDLQVPEGASYSPAAAYSSARLMQALKTAK